MGKFETVMYLFPSRQKENTASKQAKARCNLYLNQKAERKILISCLENLKLCSFKANLIELDISVILNRYDMIFHKL